MGRGDTDNEVIKTPEISKSGSESSFIRGMAYAKIPFTAPNLGDPVALEILKNCGQRGKSKLDRRILTRDPIPYIPKDPVRGSASSSSGGGRYYGLLGIAARTGHPAPGSGHSELEQCYDAVKKNGAGIRREGCRPIR